MKLEKSNSLVIAVVAILAGGFFTSCDNNNEAALELPDAKTIFIDIDIAQVIEQATPGDEVPDFVKMYNGKGDFKARTNGEANLITEVVAGDEVIWQLDELENVHIISFDFQVLEGEDFFEQTGGSYPEQQEDGSWKATISQEALEGTVIKYSIYFEIEGQGTYWWDPLMRTSSDLPPS